MYVEIGEYVAHTTSPYIMNQSSYDHPAGYRSICVVAQGAI
uniref:Uncharacterized protein n=1 Tax=Arundo donax TaxID=35708 RepID=A0A0A8ZPZ2_ARUDO